MRDIFCNVHYNAWASKLLYASDTVDDDVKRSLLYNFAVTSYQFHSNNIFDGNLC